MNYATIKKFDIANGPGVRVSVFVSGCRHKCKNCFNSEAWDFNYGEKFDESVIDEVIEAAGKGYIEGISLLGGEPMESENRGGLTTLLKKFKEKYPEKTVWCYTGYVFDEELLKGKAGDVNSVKELLSYIDVLVDGRYVEELKSLALLFRGSSNQRIIDVKKSLKENKTVLLSGKWERTMGSTDIEEE